MHHLCGQVAYAKFLDILRWIFLAQSRPSDGPNGKLSKREEEQILHITKSVITEKQESFFTERNTSHHKKYFTLKYFTSQQVFFLHKSLDVTDKFLHQETSQILKHDCNRIIMDIT